MMRFTLALVSAVALLVSASRGAHATVVTEVALPTMTDSADLIVRGVVEKRRTSNESGRLFTQVTVRITELHKGSAPKSGKVVVRTVGGRQGVTISRISGEPTFELGEEVFLFLNASGHYHRVVAMAQGKFDIVRDPISRAEHLTRDLSGLTYVTQGDAGQLTLTDADDVTAAPLSYRDIVQTVRLQVVRSLSLRQSAAPAAGTVVR